MAIGETKKRAAVRLHAAHASLAEYKEEVAARNLRLAHRLYRTWRDPLLKTSFRAWRSVFEAREEVRHRLGFVDVHACAVVWLCGWCCRLF